MSRTSLKIMVGHLILACMGIGGWAWVTTSLPGADVEKKPKPPFNITTPHISTDPAVKYDYDIVYVRTPRKGNAPHSSRWADASFPMNVDAGGDLMLLHPDGSEERLVEGGNGSITDPFVSFDGEWVYYAHFDDLRQRQGQGGAAAARLFANERNRRRDHPCTAVTLYEEDAQTFCPAFRIHKSKRVLDVESQVLRKSFQDADHLRVLPGQPGRG